MNPNENYFKLFPNHDFIVKPMALTAFDNQSKIGAITALYSIAKRKGILDCLNLAFEKDDAELILSLASYYILARDSASMLYSDFMFDHYGIMNKIASESSISRLFNHSMENKKIDLFRSAYLKHCFVELTKQKKKKRFYVDIDSTNINVSSSKCNLAEFGKPKVDEDLPQINMAYFYDRNSGIPIFYDSFYGSIADISYCTKGIRSFLDNLNVNSKSVSYDFILDRGYFSESNMESLVDNGISFAVMGKKTKVFADLLANNRNNIKSSANMISIGNYGRKIQSKAFKNENSHDYYIYLYYDSTKEIEERTGIESRLLNAKKALEGKDYDRNDGLERTYGNYLIIEKSKTTKRIKNVTVNSDNVDSMLNEGGYFWIVSIMNMEPNEMLKAYQERDEIKKCFCLVKSESDLNKTYAQNDVALNAKLLMGFITAILRSEFISLTRKVAKDKSNLSTQKMLLALDKIIMYQVNGHYALKYEYTSLQQEILNAIDVKKEEIEAVINSCNSNKIS